MTRRNQLDQGLMEITAGKTASFLLGRPCPVPATTSHKCCFCHWGILWILSFWIYSQCCMCLKFHIRRKESIFRTVSLGMFLFPPVLPQSLPHYGKDSRKYLMNPDWDEQHSSFLQWRQSKRRNPGADSSSVGQIHLRKTLCINDSFHAFFFRRLLL